ncbi:MAG: hypothetical protein ACNS60_20330 [Candidatus Cyclobacteriaceae bacterium M2_1C_046]
MRQARAPRPAPERVPEHQIPPREPHHEPPIARRAQPGEMVVRRDAYDKKLIEMHRAYVYRNQMYFEVETYRSN